MTGCHMEYLGHLRVSGATNMMGAVPYLLRDFPELTKREAETILFYWLNLK